MSEPESALGGATFNGLIRIGEAPRGGLLVLRGGPDVQALVLDALGLAIPGQRRIVVAGPRMAGWMAPDELLLRLPQGEVAPLLAQLHPMLAGRHHLLAEIGDSRCLLRLEGPRWREVLAKAAPVDLAPGVFLPGELRRSRVGQVAATFWAESADVALLLCPRSVAGYVFDLLSVLARPGSEVGLFD